MSTIATSLTEAHFHRHVYPHLSTAKRGYECKIPLFKVFNYILHKLHTGCQWASLPMDPDPNDAEKKNSVMTQFIITFASGAAMGACGKCLKVVS